MASEKADAYVGAQKLWERIGGLQEIPENGLGDGISDMGAEVAMRGTRHVLLGLERGARYTGRQWRAILNNYRTEGARVTQLFQEYERDAQRFRNNNPGVNTEGS